MVVSSSSEKTKSQVPLLTLASSSIHRQKLLCLLGIDFRVQAPRITEQSLQKSPDAYAQDIAWKKLSAVKPLLQTRLALSADTVIALDDELLGKPSHREEARQTLQKLCGRTHRVYTAFVLWDTHTQQEVEGCSLTRVRMLALSDTQIERYLSYGEWQNVAGAYQIQGHAAAFISHIEGTYTGVVGLPLHMLYNKLLSYYINY